MLIDITLSVTPQMARDAQNNQNPALAGHLGTHFDAMDKEFPLEYTCLPGVVFDVSHAKDREIGVSDVDLNAVEKGAFVAFRTGYIEEVGYGVGPYFKEHPILSFALIDALLAKGVRIIGLDFAGIRRTPEHIPADRRCAENGTFVVENLQGLRQLTEKGGRFTAHTYPMRLTGYTGLPCRVVAEI